MSRRARVTVFLATVPLVAFIVVGGFLDQAAAREDAYRHLRIFEDVVSLIASNYVEEVDLDTVMQGALQGLAGGLDADSTFLSADDVTRMESGGELPPGEIGVVVMRQYYTQIIAVRDGSPAARAGLTTGDYIRTIDGQTTRLISAIEAERLLHGEPGSTVSLSLLRGNTQEPYDLELTREALTGPVVTDRVVSDDVGYIRVAAFSAGVSDTLQQRIDALVADGATSLIVDVRNTAGGVFEEGIAAARLFVSSGTLVQRSEHDDVRFPVEATADGTSYDLPVVLLTNPGTTDAAELFVAGLAGAERADTVGQRTGGRVSLQKLVKLPDGTGLWLSWARYLTRDGDPIHRFGIPVTVEVDTPFVELGEPRPAGDPVLERGLEHLQTLL